MLEDVVLVTEIDGNSTLYVFIFFILCFNFYFVKIPVVEILESTSDGLRNPMYSTSYVTHLTLV